MDLHADPGIPESVRVTVSTDVGPVLDAPLIKLALTAKVSNGVVLPFTYRVPFDQEEPNELRPLRRAIIMILHEDDPGYPKDAQILIMGDRARARGKAVEAPKDLERQGQSDEQWIVSTMSDYRERIEKMIQLAAMIVPPSEAQVLVDNAKDLAEVLQSAATVSPEIAKRLKDVLGS